MQIAAPQNLQHYGRRRWAIVDLRSSISQRHDGYYSRHRDLRLRRISLTLIEWDLLSSLMFLLFHTLINIYQVTNTINRIVLTSCSLDHWMTKFATSEPIFCWFVHHSLRTIIEIINILQIFNWRVFGTRIKNEWIHILTF